MQSLNHKLDSLGAFWRHDFGDAVFRSSLCLSLSLSMPISYSGWLSNCWIAGLLAGWLYWLAGCWLAGWLAAGSGWLSDGWIAGLLWRAGYYAMSRDCKVYKDHIEYLHAAHNV